MTDAYSWTAEFGIVSWDKYQTEYKGRKNACHKPGKKVNHFKNILANEEDMVPN